MMLAVEELSLVMCYGYGWVRWYWVGGYYWMDVAGEIGGHLLSVGDG